MVVFLSDHGEMLGAHGMREKNVFYEESARIPLILKVPGKIKANTVVSDPVSLVDVFPTILDYLGAGEHKSDGESVRRFIEGYTRTDTFAVSEWLWHGGSKTGYMVTTRDWKFMCPFKKDSAVINALYDLKNDPDEMHNLVGNNPDREKYRAQAERMKAMLVLWLEKNHSKNLDGVRSRPVV